ncbi:MAG: cupin domain-containing protein [Thermodesulfobacteriota bacterium]
MARAAGLDRRACRRLVEERFTAARMVGDYLRLYEEIMAAQPPCEHRPWGWFEVLGEGATSKVKRIVVLPGQRLSLQRHQRRSEHWTIEAGEAVVTRDGEEIRVRAGGIVEIPRGAWHRVRNPGPTVLVILEVQTGEYFGEDDIERREDDYGRA